MWLFIGMSAWWSSSAIAAQLPVFIMLDNGFRMANLITVCVHIGGVSPLVVRLMRPTSRKSFALVVCMTQISALVALMLCARFWYSQLIVCVSAFLAGGTGAMSNVVVFGFVSRASPRHQSTLSFGMAAGGFVAISLTCWQLLCCPTFSWRTPTWRFSPPVFFAVATCVQALISSGVIRMLLLETLQNNRLQQENDFLGSLEPSTISAGMSSLRERSANSTSEPRSLVGNDVVWEESLATTSTTQSTVDGQISRNRGSRSTRFVVYIFMLYFVSYSMVSLLPFVASAYGGHQQQLLLSMLILQHTGDGIGRYLRPCVKALLGFLCLFVTIFGFLSSFAVEAKVVQGLSYDDASVVLPVSTGLFYMFRGLCLSTTHMAARSQAPLDVRLVAGMAQAGQAASLSANAIMFVLVNFVPLFKR